MYKKIMVPVDLEHKEQLDKALAAAADLSKHYSASVCYVGITTETPSAVAHTPQEFAQKLDQFGREKSEAAGIQAETKAYASHDPAVDLDDTLEKAVKETGADLVVMATHVPTFADHLFKSHGGRMASDLDVSVFLVR